MTVPSICVFAHVTFLGVFWHPLGGAQGAPENATHPKTQILGTIDYLRSQVCCVFWCVLFSSDLSLKVVEVFENMERISHMKLQDETSPFSPPRRDEQFGDPNHELHDVDSRPDIDQPKIWRICKLLHENGILLYTRGVAVGNSSPGHPAFAQTW